MRKFVLIMLFLAVILAGWMLLSTASVSAFLMALPQEAQITLAIVTLIVMGVWAYAIDPYLGECIFRIGAYLFALKFDKNAKLEFPPRGGSGSGRSGRGN